MSGGFGIHLGGCLPRIIVAAIAIGALITIIVGALLGAPNLFTRPHGQPIRTGQYTTATCPSPVANHRTAEARR